MGWSLEIFVLLVPAQQPPEQNTPMEPEELSRKFREFVEKTTDRDEGTYLSKKEVLEFCRDNGIDINESLVKTREFPKNAYADELERYPVLKDH